MAVFSHGRGSESESRWNPQQHMALPSAAKCTNQLTATIKWHFLYIKTNDEMNNNYVFYDKIFKCIRENCSGVAP